MSNKLSELDELVALFKQHGGQIDNVEIRHSDELGYYCYSLSPKKSSIMSCPASLLVDTEDIGINEDGLFISNREKYGENINFLNQYFLFHFNRNLIKYHIERKRQIENLSDNDKEIIAKIFPPELFKLDGITDLDYARKRIIDCHNKIYLGRSVIMPFVSFVNFHKNGRSFKTDENKISISGKFNGEVVAKYNEDDVLKMAGGYDFIGDTKYIYSIPLKYRMANGKTLLVNRNPLDAIELGNGRWKPLVTVKSDSVTLSWFPLYLDGAPIFPAVISKMIADEIHVPAENILYNVIRLNLHALIPAAFLLKASTNEFARFLGSVAQRQLETIAGLRELQ